MTLQIAIEIRNQIGAGTLFMLGAQHIYGSEDSLSFKIRGSKKCNFIKITLTPMDLYKVEFKKIRAGEVKEVFVWNDVYAEDLHSIIEQGTGLCAHFPKFAGQ